MARRLSDAHRFRLFALAAVLLAVFLLYAGAVRLMPFNDDITQVAELAGITPLTIFENRYAPFSLVFGHYRPMGYLPWVLIGQWFGWHTPAMLHMLNVWVHLIATALVAALAVQVARRFKLPRTGLAVVASAMFGFLPLAYSAVLWSAAVVHAQVTMFGLAAAWAYLILPERGRRRMAGLAVVALLVLLTCLSHEMGPNFGAFLVWAEVMRAAATRTRLRAGAFVLFGISVVYFLGYRLLLVTDWTSSHSLLLEGNLAEMPAKLAYHLQNLVLWPAAALRPFVNAGEAESVLLIFILAAIVVGLAFFLLAKARMARAGLFALGFWLIGALPSLTLSQRYLLDGPRLLYPPTFGCVLFWALITVAAWRLVRQPLPRLAIAAAWVVALAWSAGYVADRLNEAARLIPVARQFDADLRRAAPADRLLLINTPFVNLVTRPAFFLGREGLPIWMYTYANERLAPLWPAGTNGIERPTEPVMHEPSLSDRETNFRAEDWLFTRGGDFRYGVFGRVVDDGGLRQAMLRSNFIYRFDYDVPGLRLTPLGEIHPLITGTAPLARLTRGAALVEMGDALAARCGNRIDLRLTWSNAIGFTEPAAVFVHVMNVNGEQIAVADRDLLDGILPLDQMPAGTTIRELRQIANVPPDAAPGFIRLGVYSRADGARYRASRADGSDWDGAEVIVPIRSELLACELEP